HDAVDRGIKDGDWVGISSRAGQTVMRAPVSELMQLGLVFATFHFSDSGANGIATDSSDWATNCPESKVPAVQVLPVSQASEWQKGFRAFDRQQQGLLRQAQMPEVVGK